MQDTTFFQKYVLMDTSKVYLAGLQKSFFTNNHGCCVDSSAFVFLLYVTLFGPSNYS